NNSLLETNKRLGLATDVLGKDIFEIYPFLTDEVRRQYRQVFEAGQVLVTEEKNEIAGREIITETRKIPVKEGELVTRVVTVIRDITEKVEMEQQVLEAEREVRGLFDHAHDAIIVFDPEHETILDANRRACELYGYKRQEFVGMSQVRFTKNVALGRERIAETLAAGSKLNFETVHLRKDGSEMALEINASVVQYKGERAILSINRDISERRAAEERIRYLTFHDRLTGLYNRACFEERIREFDTPEHFPLSLVMGDANGLKLVNDAFGHDAGDKFLRQIAEIVKACARSGDLIFRWGGDEFVILMPRTDNAAAQAACDAIHRACRETPEDPIRPSIALGAGTKTEPGQSINQVMMEAEDRMYRHKLVESKSLRSSIISSLGRTLWEADYETEEHALRLQALAREFGRALKLTDSEMNDLLMLAALHDIGKIAIADGILLKPSMLSEDEWEIVRKHPEIGFRIAQASPELAPIAEGILTHHERWNGSGYPQGLRAERIPVIARILAIIDAYDVMTQKRLYKATVSKEEAIAELERCAGSQFDPKLVDLFVKIISRK
ncbi:MAG: diguanylate cyclase, partial [Candidatus Edwardsbacteria bacterium]|nr:diguanylate cyclase [Candidatus Edwardsbacteria bacterium]